MLVVAASACSPSHRVSPWGQAERPPLYAFVAKPDLETELALVDAETKHLGLVIGAEIPGKLSRGGGSFRIRSYTGKDAIGRTTSAVRIATPRGVVLAIGPLRVDDIARDRATELVPALVTAKVGSAFSAGSDINGDGLPDVVLKGERGTLEIWHFELYGSGRYEVDLEASPTRTVDVDQDHRPDLGGTVDLPNGDPIAPAFDDIATFERGRYSNASKAARAYHAAFRDRAVEPPKTDETRLRTALERAWHAILAGDLPDPALRPLDREPVPARLRSSFELHRKRLEKLALKPRT